MVAALGLLPGLERELFISTLLSSSLQNGYTIVRGGVATNSWRGKMQHRFHVAKTLQYVSGADDATSKRPWDIRTTRSATSQT